MEKKDIEKVIEIMQSNIESSEKLIKTARVELKKFEEPKQKYITVTDGWRGSLKLKECWGRERAASKWQIFENVEVISRHDAAEFPFKMLTSEGEVFTRRFIKFLPFSPENPPSVDWPVVLADNRIRHFKKYHNHNVVLFGNRCSSITNDNTQLSESVDSCKFLNIEEVE